MQRILVYGVTGSGKTTLAARVAARLGLPFHAMDELTWEPGWVPVPEAEQRRRVAEVVAQDAWVIDAAYGTWIDLVLDRVDLVVGLDLPRALSLSRLVRRTVTNVVRRNPTCNGNVETWRNAFFDRESILAWHFRSFRRKRARMRQWQTIPDFPDLVLLRNPAEVERWFAALLEGSCGPSIPGDYAVNMSEFASEGSQAAEEETEFIGASPDDPAPGSNDDSIKDPSDWVSGDDPITDSQRSYLDSLARQAGETLPAQLNKAEASEHIDRLRSKLNLSD